MATSLQALLDSVVDKLDPLKKIPYHAELYSAGLRTPDAIKAVRTPREVMEAAEIPFDDASTIWTAAGGGTGKQADCCVTSLHCIALL